MPIIRIGIVPARQSNKKESVRKTFLKIFHSSANKTEGQKIFAHSPKWTTPALKTIFIFAIDKKNIFIRYANYTHKHSLRHITNSTIKLRVKKKLWTFLDLCPGTDF